MSDIGNDATGSDASTDNHATTAARAVGPGTVPATDLPAPDVLRAAYAELVVTDLAAARQFYVDVLGLVVTHEDDEAIYLRTFEEFIHHNLVLRRGPVAA